MVTYRPAVRAPKAMIASAHPLATAAGLAMLRAGGGAVDAGLAVNAVLNVTQIPCCGFGGDAFFLYFEAATGELHAYNASGRAPGLATIAAMRERGHETMPATGPLSVTVPGALDGWARLHERFGQLPWAEAWAPAIGYARDGFPVSDKLAEWIRGAQERLWHYPSSSATLLPGGDPPAAGRCLRQPNLADTFAALAAAGAEAFYRGEVGRAVARAVGEAGGLLNSADLAAHQGAWTRPVGATYRGLDIRVHGPNSQGWTLPAMLKLVEHLDLTHLPVGGPELVHLGVEAKRVAFADRDAYNTDPAQLPVDVERLLAPDYLARRRALLNLDHASPDPAPGNPDGDTTYFAVVDPAGNALSVIQSLYHGFGSGFVAGETGLLLQNRGAYFSLDPAHVNALAPGKRTAHTLCAAMVLRDGRPAIVPGTMGGDGQPQILFQLLTAMIDQGFNPQQAIELPRWVHGDREHHDILRLEGRFDESTFEQLRERGHHLERVADWASVCGHAQVITITDDGLAGGADPRGDGQAAGF